MAELKAESRKNRVERLHSYASRLRDGDIAFPLDTRSMGELKPVAEAIEELRIKLVEQRDAKSREEERIQSLIADVTHDLKTPLALISGFAECAEDGMDDQNYPALIREKADAMNEMVLRIIDSSRAAGAAGRESMRLYETKAFFSAELAKHEKLAQSKNIKLKIRRIPSAVVFAEEKGLSSVVQNLVSNSVKYTPEGGAVTVSFSKSKKKFRFTVRDNGIGISAEELPKIFDRFYKADRSRTNSGSSGLGLYIARETVLRYGGSIDCRSREGKGSSFTVTLPVYDVKGVGNPYAKKMWQSVFYLAGFPLAVCYWFGAFFYYAAKAARANRK